MLDEYIYYYEYIHHIMEVLTTDIIVYLVETFLDDFDKTQLMVISKGYYSLRFKLMFNNEIQHKLIGHLDYYNNFTNLIINDLNFILPTKIKYLTFGWNFNRPIEGCIPNSVTHLTFGYYFNQPIEGCIPNSVTHLTFYGKNKRELYEKNIPKSIKNVMFN